MFDTMAEVKKANKEIGHFFFSKDTMRFFDSRVESVLYKNQCFVTSEKACFEDYTRVYTVRQVESDGEINTISDKFRTVEAARAFGRNF